MNKYHRDLLRMCTEVGLHPNKIKYGKKHLRIVCDEGMLFCASSPSDWRSMRNLRSQAKRLIT